MSKSIYKRFKVSPRGDSYRMNIIFYKNVVKRFTDVRIGVGVFNDHNKLNRLWSFRDKDLRNDTTEGYLEYFVNYLKEMKEL